MTAASLQISPKVSLPVDTITDTVGIFGTRGAGKTSTAVVIVEEAHRLGLPVVILDVKGDWWGLRSDRVGTSEGLPFVIFGGDHGDVPLEPTAGAVIADLIVDERPDAIIDLSDMSKTKQRTFATAFAERLYRRNREALLVVVDEADVLIPQRATAETARLVGAWDDVAKRGRGRGLGLLVVTQRPQDVAKSVLDEMHSLLLHGTIGPRAVGAIKAWIADHDDNEASRTKEVLQSLRSLQPGECWLWAPQHEILNRTRVRRILTFDSHETPKPGVKRRQPKRLAAIDLDKVREQIAATVERAEATDPKALQRKVADLQRQLTEAQAATPEPERVEVPVLTEADHEALDDLLNALDIAGQQIANVEGTLDKVMQRTGHAEASAPLASVRTIAGLGAIRREDVTGPVEPRLVDVVRAEQAAAGRREQPRGVNTGTEPNLPKAQKAILTVLRTHGDTSVQNLAILTGYAASGGGFRNSLSALRTAGYVVGKDPVVLTQEGADAIGPVPPLPRGSALREQWKDHNAIGKAHGLILDVLAEFAPDPVEVQEVALRAGYEPTGGGFRNAVSRLRTLGLIHGRDPLSIDPRLVD